MSDNKTVETSVSPQKFLSSTVDSEDKLKDSKKLIKMMSDATGAKPKMWGSSIIGFGSYHYRYESGREGDFLIVGFSPRKSAISLYVLNGFKGQDELLEKLGKHKKGKGCLYIKKLSDVNSDVLREIIVRSVKHRS